MDYDALFRDVVEWIGQANQAAMKYGMDKSEFWQWVAESSSGLCKKYHENRLVIKLMMTMVEWLEEVYEGRNQGGKAG